MAAAQRDVFPIFRLARELRDQIYEEADAPLRLQCAEAAISYGSTVTLTNAPNVGLLLANKQTRSEYLAARSRRVVTQRLVIQVDKSCKPTTPSQSSASPSQRSQQKADTFSAVAKRLEAVSYLDVHFAEENEWRLKFLLTTLQNLLLKIAPRLRNRTVNLIMHKNLLGTTSGPCLVPALRLLERAIEALFGVRAWRDAAVRATHIGASILIHMPLFTPYTCNIYSGIDPDGRIPDLVKNHKQNQILVEMQKSKTHSRFIDVRSLPFCTPGSYHQMETEILDGFLEVYEKERDVEELVADLKAVRLDSRWAMDPLDYAGYVDGRE
ncbi:hypothetical protein HII31_00026 [Pseudocercospora fuligena]|uniref:Uncharacterized protein n=1 Tax=Pseudocercospora fuligena TaxID=685502 RepID=A0A8H6RVP5_9PEZI|nr:hypothetical protein HII31_00026 [Pseudocercospora fuligena]